MHILVSLFRLIDTRSRDLTLAFKMASKSSVLRRISFPASFARFIEDLTHYLLSDGGFKCRLLSVVNVDTASSTCVQLLVNLFLINDCSVCVVNLGAIDSHSPIISLLLIALNDFQYIFSFIRIGISKNSLRNVYHLK